MKKKRVAILDPAVDDLCAILAQTIRRPVSETTGTKKKRPKDADTTNNRHPPDDASPSNIE